ncbi:MAG: hypothetical protein ACE5GQ_02760 [Nitrospinales bacterium]
MSDLAIGAAGASANIAQALGPAASNKVQEAQKQEGEAALQLIENAPQPGSDTTGRNIDIKV